MYNYFQSEHNNIIGIYNIYLLIVNYGRLVSAFYAIIRHFCKRVIGKIVKMLYADGYIRNTFQFLEWDLILHSCVWVLCM